jgi:hypothetical protein
MQEKEEILPGVIDHELKVGLELVHTGVLVRLQLLLDLHDVNGIVHCFIIPGLPYYSISLYRYPCSFLFIFSKRAQYTL